MTYNLKGRVALVTGGSGGIGQQAALALGAAGAYVFVHYHSNAEGARATLEQLETAGGAGLIVGADLTHEEEIVKLVARIQREQGRLDILFNNAGSPVRKALLAECPTDLWREVFEVNVTSAFVLTREVTPLLKASGRGAIVNNLSLSIQSGGAGGAGAYAAAKGALQVMTRTWAKELAPSVRTNAIQPGVIETKHHEVFSTPEKLAEYRSQTPLGRNGQADEVAEAVVFLASDAARFINGAILDINGGRFLR